MKARALVWLIVVLTAAFLIGLVYRDGLQSQHSENALLQAPAGCDPQQRPCLAGDTENGLAFALPESARLMQPFPVQVRVLGSLAQSVVVDFRMRDMDMGVNRVGLAPADGDLWRGTATLPVCVSGRADWLAVVEASSEQGDRRASFAFSVAP